jgi:hypothetical protein
MPNSTKVFRDFDYDLRPYLKSLPSGWYDASWGNDACPHFENMDDKSADTAVAIWMDYKDPELRESPDSKQFNISMKYTGETFLVTDDWDALIKALKSKEFETWYEKQVST